jgi:GntR family transcriptional regulator
MVALDRRSPLPLWAQLLEELRERLAANEYDPSFPTDAELAATYGVSRHTVREAVRRLQDAGLVVRSRGRSGIVSQAVLEQPLHSLYSLSSSLRALGLEEKSKVRVSEVRAATADAAAALGIAVGAKVVYLDRIRLADGEPIAWDRSWLPLELAAGLLDVDLSDGGIYEALAHACGVRVTGGGEKIRPVVPDAAERRLLAMAPRVAAFSIDRHVVAHERRVEWRLSLIRGDRYSLVAQWPSGPDGPAWGDTPGVA